MPSAFEQLFTGSLDSFYDMYGLPATYTGPDGTAITSITVRVHRQESRQVPFAQRGTGELQTGEVLVRESEVAKPVSGGRFMVEGHEVWTIASTPVLKNGQHHCTCSRGGAERIMERRAKA